MTSFKSEAVITASAIIGTAFNVAQFAAQFTPIPALAPTLAAVCVIIQTCEQITSNKSEIRHLQERCRCLVEALNDPQYINSQSAESLVNISANATSSARSPDAARCTCKSPSLGSIRQTSPNLQGYQILQECHARAYEKDREELSQALKGLRENGDETLQIVTHSKNQIEALLRLLQTELRSFQLDSPAYRNIQESLYSVHKRSGELPPEVNLAGGEARRVSRFPRAGNATFDIWEGLWLGHEKVAMKTLRGVRVSPETRKRYLREIEVWRKIWAKDGGRYILPLYGVSFDDSPFPYMVSPWMTNGNVVDYLDESPMCDRPKLIIGIAKGLRFLHHDFQPPIAHGGIKGANILIDDSGNPLLADFGLSKGNHLPHGVTTPLQIIEDFSGVPFTQSQGAIDSFRWFAPEMCRSPGIISTCSDVFAFAMTIIEIITMRFPYDHIKLTTEVLIRMQDGERPNRPRDMSDQLWEVCTACWKPAPHERATIAWVVEILERPN
ncbi:hypothetical protein Clacol_001641 [Clathrus columnatus]|uniref:Protein kinase domain-containing protein n=1 Tax=Clathrus columnatus TaxID=1419009 RepID=A0AAV4ZYP3_9AGAM|nr:hypothetical protein Clacol_001641 [Clathrus columnatus]